MRENPVLEQPRNSGFGTRAQSFQRHRLHGQGYAGAGRAHRRPTESSLVCVFLPEAFRDMVPGRICDTGSSQEVVQSICVATLSDLEALRGKVERAGGRLLGDLKDQPWGKAFGFSDPDGHIGAVLWFSQ